MNRYVKAPDVISFKDCVNKNYNLSSSLFTKLIISNTNNLPVSSFLTRKLENRDLGCEIGSLSYIDKSTHYFLRTKALQENSFIPDITGESALPMRPTDFVNMNLKKGDLIISKDSNIGEIVILEKDYPNYMLSGAMYKLPVKEEYKYYLFSMIKHDIFREQLDSIVPKGATIRHAKTLFLDCLIPLPNKNTKNVIEYVSKITKAIIKKETFIKKRHEQILKAIQEELENNQKDNEFKYSMPTLSEVSETGRLDTGIYSEIYKKNIYLIENYSNGYFYIKESDIDSGCTPDIRYIDNNPKLKYQWVTPSFCSDYGTIDECRINLVGTNNINKDSILIINRTSKGGIGEFVGITSFYNFEELHEGQHNQGIYRVSSYDKTKLLFILCCLNCKIYRKICASLSVGSKMKEIKAKHISTIPFPKFPEPKQKEITKLYYNQEITYDTSSFTLENFITKDSDFNKSAGIYELDKSAKYLKELLNSAIDNIVNDVEVDIKF